MKALAFEHRGRIENGRSVRRACFRNRSLLPVSAACLVANSVRESLAASLGAPVAMRLFEPVVPDRAAWAAIVDGAQLFRVQGPLADAVLVLRRRDALKLAVAAFGECAPPPERELSAIEREVLERAMQIVAGCLTPVCGASEGPLERIAAFHGYTTYFELLVEQPIDLRIGVALSRETLQKANAGVRREDLGSVAIDLCVEFASGTLDAAAFLRLRAGDIVPLSTKLSERGLLKAGNSIVARGECGALNGRNAFVITATTQK